MGGLEVSLASRGGAWGGGIPFPIGEGCPSSEIFLYFLLKIPYFDAF